MSENKFIKDYPEAEKELKEAFNNIIADMELLRQGHNDILTILRTKKIIANTPPINSHMADAMVHALGPSLPKEWLLWSPDETSKWADNHSAKYSSLLHKFNAEINRLMRENEELRSDMNAILGEKLK